MPLLYNDPSFVADAGGMKICFKCKKYYDQNAAFKTHLESVHGFVDDG